MLKCASKCLLATIRKGLLGGGGGNGGLTAKVVRKKKCNFPLTINPASVEGFNRHYGFYKTKCGEEEEKKGSKEKRTSFLGGIDNNVFDALKWSGVLILGYYFLQPFKPKRQTLASIGRFENATYSKLSGYQTTLNYFVSNFSCKPFNCVLPEVKAAKSHQREKKEASCGVTLSENSESDEEPNAFEKAQQKVMGVLCNWVGIQYLESGNHKKALEFFFKSAKEEYAAGIFNLGICQERGLGTSQDFKKAAELYQRATDLGHAPAMYNLGVFYAQGIGGVTPDVDRARELFKAAARLGQKDAEKALILEEEVLKEFSERNNSSLEDNNYDDSVIKCSSGDSPEVKSHNSTESLKLSDSEEKSCDDELLFCRKEMSSLYDSDSGILDLSPQMDSLIHGVR